MKIYFLYIFFEGERGILLNDSSFLIRIALQDEGRLYGTLAGLVFHSSDPLGHEISIEWLKRIAQRLKMP